MCLKFTLPIDRYRSDFWRKKNVNRTKWSKLTPPIANSNNRQVIIFFTLFVQYQRLIVFVCLANVYWLRQIWIVPLIFNVCVCVWMHKICYDCVYLCLVWPGTIQFSPDDDDDDYYLTNIFFVSHLWPNWHFITSNANTCATFPSTHFLTNWILLFLCVYIS